LIPALLAGCYHVDGSKYEQLYFKKAADAALAPASAPLTATAAAAAQAAAPVNLTRTPVAISKKPPLAAEQPAKKRSQFRVKELVINSDTMNYNKDTGEAVFTGNVATEAANVLINSDRLVSKDYKDNAQATGNVKAFYKEYGLTIYCKKMDYTDKLSKIYAQEDVTAIKADKGNTITMYADELVFNTADDTMTAVKKKNRVKLTMKDILAFSNKVIYNDETREALLTGSPLVKKMKSVFMADEITINVDTKTMKMKDNIWSKLLFKDFEVAQKESKK
jgi:lipopolysaccharide assembly outer membrane protein LptD (OstA)